MKSAGSPTRSPGPGQPGSCGGARAGRGGGIQEGKTQKVLAEVNMGSSVYGTPVPANGVLFVNSRNQLFAITASPGQP